MRALTPREVLCLVLAVAWTATGCTSRQSSPAPPPTASAPENTAAPSIAEIRGMTIPGLPGLAGPATLVDGTWEGAPYVAGGAARPRVQLVDRPPLVGDLDRDGRPEAAVLLTQTAAGTGVMVYLAVVERSEGGVAVTATAAVGDRVQLRGSRLENGAVVLDLVQAGRADAMCCPGDLATRTWRLDGGALVETAPRLTGRLTPEVMTGAEWFLVAWGRNEPAPEDPRPSFRFEDGRMTGFSGCNRFFAPVSAGSGPGEVAVGPVGGTKMFCIGAPMEIEQRFAGLLGAVDRIGFLDGRLALTATVDGAPTTMLFEARDTP